MVVNLTKLNSADAAGADGSKLRNSPLDTFPSEVDCARFSHDNVPKTPRRRRAFKYVSASDRV